ncbi:MAG: DUF1273 family protein [Oscillospiraceae bacterium]|nr:DUF1273 family protein [Oscillospiraceae bacterium]
MRARAISCCFSGYRPDKLPWGEEENDPRCLALKSRLQDAVEAACQEGFCHFIVGMADGVDLYCCELVQSLRSRYPITVEAAVPCRGQAGRWSRKKRLRYDVLLAGCDQVTVLQEEYDPGCMLRRNRYMVDHAAMLIAVFDGQPGGTQSTVAYAMKKGLAITLIPPV